MKLFFLDIDGTIAVPGSPPSELLGRTISGLQAQGDKVFLCTGRTESFTPEAVKALGCDGGIYSAGGRIVVQGREIFSEHLPEKTKEDILALLDRLEAHYNIECEPDSYYGGSDLGNLLTDRDPSDGMHSELLRLLSVFHRQRPFEEYRGEPAYKISFLLPSAQAVQQIRAMHPAGTSLVFFQNKLSAAHVYFGEISDEKISKGAAMKWLCQLYGLTPADCVAYGDSMNDASILRTAGEGVAMGNAAAEVQAIADRACGSCAEDGLALDLQRYLHA